MNNTIKFLIGVGVTAVGVGVTVHYIKKMNENKFTTIKESDEDTQSVIKEESTIDKIKLAACKKAVRILGWVVTHKNQVEAIASIISLGGAVFTVANAIRDFRTGRKLQTTLDTILWHQEQFQSSWNDTIDNYDANWDGVIKKLENIHLDLPHDGMAV